MVLDPVSPVSSGGQQQASVGEGTNEGDTCCSLDVFSVHLFALEEVSLCDGFLF